MKVFLTGAAGFVGSNMVRKLLLNGDEVHVLVRPSTDRSRISDIEEKLVVHEGDFGDFSAMKELLGRVRPNGVFHFAAANMASGQAAPDEELMRVNAIGTMNLMRAAAEIGFDFFINIGSFLEYGKKDHSVKESELCVPGEAYSISKLSATLYGVMLGKNKRLPIITLRLFTPYGPYVQEGRLIHSLISKSLSGESISLTNPKVSRDFIFIDDVTDLCLQAATRAAEFPGEIFNLGSSKPVSLEELAKLTLLLVGSSSEIKWGDFHAVSYDSDLWAADMEKTFASFAWKPKISLEDGIKMTIEWFAKAHSS